MPLKQISRIGVVLLLALSLLGWLYIPNLYAWEFSIVTTQLGPFFALVVIVIWLIGRPRDFATLAVTLAALASYLAPTVEAMIDYPGVVSVAQLLSPVEKEVPFKRLTFTAANGKTPLNIDYYTPESKASKPWILVVHGGGWINGDSQQLPELNWHLVKRGYAVVSVDYRLSPGWLWPSQRDDVYEALKFVKAHAAEWNLDVDKWAILGRSAGAQIAGVVAYSAKENKPKAFISYYDPTDLVFGYGIGTEDDILHSRKLLRGFLGGTPEEQPALYESASVIESLKDGGCPALLIHGLHDTIVYVKHSQRLYEAMKLKKIAAQLVLLPFGPHGFDYFFNGAEAQVATRKVDDFLARELPVR